MIPADTQALIFDCDGTLADTMPAHYRAWVQTLNSVGIHFSEERFYQLGGMPTERIIALLAAEQGRHVEDIPALSARKEAAFEVHLDQVRVVPEVVAIAAEYRDRLPMAVASGGYRNVICRVLEHLRIADWFTTVVTAEDTVRHKPEPDVFLEAARRLGVPARSCVVFEDTDLGLEAARRAGMFGIDIRPLRV